MLWRSAVDMHAAVDKKGASAGWTLLVSTGLVLAASGTIRLLIEEQNSNQRSETRGVIIEEGEGGDHGQSVVLLLVEDEDENDNDDRSSSSSSSFRKDSFLIFLAGVTLSNAAMATSGKALGSLRGRHLAIAFVCYLVSSVLGIRSSLV
jgi:hypothetical protein